MLKYMFECLVTFYSKLVDLNQWIISFISFGRSGSRVLRTLGKRCEYALLHNLGLPNQNTCFKGKKLYNLEVTHTELTQAQDETEEPGAMSCQ